MTLLRLLGAAALLAVGAATGVAAVATHDLWWGLPLATAALLAGLVAVGRGWLTRIPLALGLAAGVGVATPTRPEGDFLIGETLRGYLLLGLACVAVLVAVATLPRPRRVPRRSTSRPATYTREDGQAET